MVNVFVTNLRLLACFPLRFGHLWAPQELVWAPLGTSQWTLAVTRGHLKVLANTALSSKILGAGDENRTRVLSLGS